MENDPYLEPSCARIQMLHLPVWRSHGHSYLDHLVTDKQGYAALFHILSHLISNQTILTLSLIQTLSEASAADGFLKTQCQKKKLLKTSNFSFCHNVFHFQSQVIHSIIETFYFLTKHVQSRLLQNCCMRERVKYQQQRVRGSNKNLDHAKQPLSSTLPLLWSQL